MILLLAQAALLVCVPVAAWAAFAGVAGGVTGSRSLAVSSGRGLVAGFFLTTLATAGLLHALLSDDFRIEYVADYSTSTQPLLYKIAAIWGGQAGSLLVWLLLLGMFAAISVIRSQGVPSRLLPWFYGVQGIVMLFFALLVAFVENPFVRLPAAQVPPDGIGLNPLLLNPWMMIHPPTLLIGYAGTTLPFAFAVAALASGRLDEAWVRLSRRWALFTFTFLTIGIVLGAYWAYVELGWGGYWAWDPVENASLMPWLVLVAYLHSSMIQERRGLLKIWNVAMASLTFLLSIYGTFLTRSGIISSVHAFAKSSIGTWFAVFMGITMLAVVALVAWRFRRLRADDSISSYVSREGVVSVTNLLFVGTTIVILFMTMLPVLSELWSGVQRTAEPIQFTRATRPWFLAIVILMGIGPLVAWRRMQPARLLKLLAPHLAAGVVFAGILFALGAREPWSLAFFGAVAFVTGGHLFDFLRALRLRRKQREEALMTSVGRLLRHHRRRYGGYLVHIGMVVSLIGIAGSGPYKVEKTFENVAPGESFSIAGYELTYKGFDGQRRTSYDTLFSHVSVLRPGSDEPAPMRPERRVYRRTNQATTEVSVLSTIVPRSLSGLSRVGEDLYLIQAFVDNSTGRASFQVIVHPFLNWLWFGTLLVVIGAHWVAWPTREEALLLFGEGVLNRAAAARA